MCYIRVYLHQIFMHHRKGNVSLVVGEIIGGIVLLFVGLFMLASIEPMFSGMLTECSYTATTPSGATVLNATLITSKNITFAAATNVQGYCTLVLNVTNDTAISGSVLEVRIAGINTFLKNVTIPAVAEQATISSAIVHSSGNWLANVTAFGGDNVTIPIVGSSLTCCDSLVAQSGPAGRYYSQVVATIAVAFSVFGLLLIVIGLGTAISTLKNSMG